MEAWKDLENAHGNRKKLGILVEPQRGLENTCGSLERIREYLWKPGEINREYLVLEGLGEYL